MKSFFWKVCFFVYCLFKRNVYVAVDVSGSIDRQWIEQINEQLKRARLHNVAIQIIEFDYVIRDIYFSQGRLKLEGHAGGGTDLSSVFDYFEKELRICSNSSPGFVIFTDGYVPAPQAGVNIRPLWFIAPNGCKLDKTYPGFKFLTK